MHIERLERLAALMDTVAKDEKPFAIDGWFQPSEHPCGFAACAIGWASLDLWFQEQGLILQHQAIENGLIHRHQLLTEDDVVKLDPDSWRPPSTNGSPMRFIAGFFGLGRHDAHMLFTQDGYSRNPTAVDVAYEIRMLLASAPVS